VTLAVGCRSAIDGEIIADTLAVRAESTRC
jgi:hypothetical protein